MQQRITAQFDSIDEAERASARLHSALRGVETKLSAAGPNGRPASSPFTASVYLPWHLGFPDTDLSFQNSSMGSRVLYTSDLMGLPVYRAQETALTITLGPDQAERASALLRNSGGRDIRRYF